MDNAAWFLLIGTLMLTMGLTAPAIRRLPVTTAIVYLAVGVIVGPTVLGAFHFNPLKQAGLLETVTEVAVLLSLFSAGLKMPVPVTYGRWRTPLFLAFLAMALTVGIMAGFGYYALGLPLGAAVLLGAILAPTDPVLATDVQIRHSGDRDRLRFGLTCEAGMNDGTAFPFVMLGLGLLGLHDIGDAGLRWALMDLAWGTVGGVALGVVCGVGIARLVWRLRQRHRDSHLMDDFIGLGLIGLVYGASLLLHVWGFLAVFFAAMSLRHTELRLTGRRPDPTRLQTTEEDPDDAVSGYGAAPAPITDATIVFKEQLERLSEVVLILLIGGTLFVDSWSWRAVATAFFLFLAARPASVFLALLGTRTPWRMRAMMGWFGVRGIGSLYYLMYAIEHGLPENVALELIHLTLIVVTLSIIVHGISVKPLMSRFWLRSGSRRPMARG
ncbi:MAG: sodium:proton antiporter [Ectothiorhodospiraceae bacterium]|jgi:NhaP-type Na+/H+ or K+/H+ antiporter